MRKFEIVEIENSYLNFFSPAVIVPASYFFFNLIGWISLLLLELIRQSNLILDLNFLTLIINNLFLGLVVIILYYLLIYDPRLKVKDSIFISINRTSFYTLIGVFFIQLLVWVFIDIIFEFFFSSLKISFSISVSSNVPIENPIYLVLYFIYEIILWALFNEIVFRRALIPMFEDRGLPLIHAIIFSALGGSFINLPGYFLVPNYPYDLYSFSFSIMIGLSAGIIYVTTRNLIFPIMFDILIGTHQFISSFISQEQMMIYESINVLFYLIAIVIFIYFVFTVIRGGYASKWVKMIKKRSNSNITKGILGFFIISLGLLAIQTLVAKVGRILFIPVPGQFFPGYLIYISIFYFIAFSIPFFLTISTEWARSPTN